MPTINEGNLVFTFQDAWRIIKYDETSYYRINIIPTASDLSAVDFIVCPSPDFSKLILIEVKDFRGYAAANRERQTSGELISEVIKKAMHTIAVIYLASYNNNPELTHFCINNLWPLEKIELILFMEEDIINLRYPNDTRTKLQIQNQKNRINYMTVSLREKLKNTVNIRSKIKNTILMEERDGFTVNHFF